MNEQIICAAIRVESSNKLFYGHRHAYCIMSMRDELSWNMSRKQLSEVHYEQGFVTTHGRFVGREVAGEIWIACGGKLQNPPQLYSEDLY